jgi:hypothetical protein
MSKKVDRYCCNQENAGGDQWAKIAPSFRGEGLDACLRFESLKIDSGPIDSGSAVRSWRVGRSDTAIEFNSQAHDLSSMDIFGSMATWRGGRPSAHDEILGGNGKCPPSININDVNPANTDLFRGIGNNDPAALENDFGFNQKNVDTGNRELRYQSAGYFGSNATQIEARPKKKTTEHESNSSEAQAGFWAVSLHLIHLVILSHMPDNSIKAVR